MEPRVMPKNDCAVLKINLLDCECNENGSTSPVCASLGGQCSCKANIVGRTCSACEHRFFSFPSCQGSRTVIVVILVAMLDFRQRAIAIQLDRI